LGAASAARPTSGRTAAMTGPRTRRASGHVVPAPEQQREAGVPHQQLGRDDALEEVEVRAVEQEEKRREVYLERPVRATRLPQRTAAVGALHVSLLVEKLRESDLSSATERLLGHVIPGAWAGLVRRAPRLERLRWFREREVGGLLRGRQRQVAQERRVE
jgi:hypothetical protein